MTRARSLKIAAALLIPSLAAAVAFVFLIRGLQEKITTRLAQGWVLTPLELYSRGILLSIGRTFPRDELERELAAQSRQPDRDYLISEGAACGARADVDADVPADQHCLWLREPALVVTWSADGWIQNIWFNREPRDSASPFPRLITQFFEGHPIQQQNITLGEVPLACLQAFVKVNPISHLVGAVRGLMNGGAVAHDLYWTLGWMAGLLAVFVPLAMRAYNRRV